TIKLVEQVLKNAVFEKKKLDEVVLVGGTTRIPAIQQVSRELFDRSFRRVSTSVRPLPTVLPLRVVSDIDDEEFIGKEIFLMRDFSTLSY
ncbi:hypothetical protein BC835DRAFT_1291436, partial [Cytidiella melzeri]